MRVRHVGMMYVSINFVPKLCGDAWWSYPMDEGDHVLAVWISRLTSRFDTMESAQSREECGVISNYGGLAPSDR